MTYKRDPNRPPTIKLTRAEWTNIITAIVLEIGEGNAKTVLINALGEERANLLIEKREGPRITKPDTHRIVQELYPFIPGETRTEKENWLIQFGRNSFGNDERFMEVLAYIRHRVGEFEAAGGTLDQFPHGQ